MSSLLTRATTKKSNHGHAAPKEGGELRPDYSLVDRNQQFKHVVKSGLAYYKGLAAIEHTAGKAISALQETIQVPFHEGHQFMGEGGWQEALYAVRDQTKILGDQHTSLANTIEETVVKQLEGVRSELKAHISAIQKEAGVLADDVDKERATSAQHLTQLQSGIDTFDNSSEQMLPQHDPYLTHGHVQKQLHKQAIKENDLQAAIIRFQQQQPAFEKGIVESMQSAYRLYDEAKATKVKEIAETEKAISEALQRVSPTAEYEFASSRPGFTLDPNTPSRDLSAITFPGLNHAATQALKEGHLERKKRFTKSYKESYYILTPSGYLHERRTSADDNTDKPGFSLFLPECSLGAPSKETDKSHKWTIEGNKAVKSSVEAKVKNTLRFGGKEIAYTFRARTHAEALAWWELLDKLSRDTKTAPTQRSVADKTASDPVAFAVANVGYADKAQSAPHAAAATSHNADADPQTIAVERAEQHQHTTAATHGHAHGHGHAAHEEEDDEESGGSSAEEEDEHARAIRTAPTTPAPHDGVKSHLDAAGAATATHTSPSNVTHTESAVESATGKAEVLPTYAGNPGGVSTAEKAALSEKGPVLGEPINVQPVNTTDNVPTASTSSTH